MKRAVALAALMLTDVGMTWLAVEHTGAVEGNPIMAALLLRTGWAGLILAKVAVFGLALAVIARMPRPDIGWAVALAMAALPVAVNLWML